MRITLVGHDAMRGDGQGEVTRRLAEGMARRGHAVHVVAHRVDADLVREPNVQVSWIRLPIVRPMLLKDLVFMTLATLAIRRAGLEDTVVHLHGDVNFARHRVNTAHFVHTAFMSLNARLSMGLNPYHVAYHRLHARLERAAFARCAGSLVAVSGKVRRELEAVVGARVPIRVIHNGTDAGAPPGRADARRRIEQEFGFDVTTRVLLFAGELRRRRKGLGTVLAAMELLGARRDVRLLVAGNQAGSPFVDEAARRGVADRVIFAGFRRDLAALLAGSDVFVFPALYDPFPGVVLEAMAAGTPVVTSSPDYCGTAEVMVPGESGIWLKDPSDPSELRDALIGLLDDPDRRRRLGEAGRAVAGSFTWKRMCDEYEMLYRSVESARSTLA